MERVPDNIVLDRFAHFVATDQWNVESNENIIKHIYPDRRELSSLFVYKVENDGLIVSGEGYKQLYKRPLFGEIIPKAFQNEKKEAKVGDSFGPSWTTFWFELNVQVPPQWKGLDVHLLWNSDSEALLFDKNGKILQGLNGGDGWDKREEFFIDADLLDADGRATFYIEMACNAMFGNGWNGQINPPDPNRYFTLKKAEIALFDRLAFDLMYDFKIVMECAKEFDSKRQRAREAIITGNDMLKCFDPYDRDSWQRARDIAAKFLGKKNGDTCHNIVSVGHCHIDIAWLWPYSETRRKAGRSWANQLRFIDMYPQYKFVQSQAQLFEWVKEDYPELFERIKQKAKEGRFIPIGGSYVECDGVLPSGESFCRQFLYGQRFFKEEFGEYCTEFSLPDSFGYSAALPQIMRLSKIDSFITQKLSWNLFNKFPNSSFLWEGIDGSSVFAHFPPADTYNASLSVKEILFNEENFKDKEVSQHSLCLFGHGDGGGGPVLDHMERAQRLYDVQGLPKIIQEKPKYFFDRLKEENRGHKLKAWRGELYLELHRGTFTSQAAVKKGNRKCELLLREAELYSALASRLTGFEYPRNELTKLWKTVLLNQFHDVLPGSSIELAYADARQLHAQVLEEAGKIRESALVALNQQQLETNSEEKEKVVTVWNSLPWERKEVIELDVVDNLTDDKAYTQKTSNGKCLAIVQVPSTGYKTVTLQELVVASAASTESMVSLQQKNNSFVLSNQFIEVTVNEYTATVDIVDLQTKRKVVQDGNRFVMYNDKCLFWDAWDIEVMHNERELPIKGYYEGSVSVTVLESGPLRCSLQVSFPISETSSLSQVISLSCVSPRLEFNTQVDWHEKHKCLKVKVPSRIFSDYVTYDHQFGFIRRSILKNTSWDVARFEVSSQKYMCISEYGNGVAVMNDCKYGCSATQNGDLFLTLLRAPKAPDANCDMGHHQFTFAIHPYVGSSFQDGRIIQSAYELNQPCNVCVYDRSLPKSSSEKVAAVENEESLISISCEQILCETLKMSEDSEQHLVLRMHECYGAHAPQSVLSIKSPQAPREVVTTNILEDADEERYQLRFTHADNRINIQVPPLKPFQIQTIKIKY
ncbi:hypothetical protein C9374_001442 [Naegleria lovaniensis]|uniref:alpha-mannosidase n=1 Tax=Naegleria lovaniensis TaxID=51637 RepID=A0AA88KMR4_NAELO|nr:uncharacterized protein C9374_001442 [Naegleria lovaniensis]KAG2387848.1 hypothetical protein C9374_001442 [Naegleria lovaniensis]